MLFQKKRTIRPYPYEIPLRESSYPLFEGGGCQPTSCPPTKTPSPYSFQSPSSHNSHVKSPTDIVTNQNQPWLEQDVTDIPRDVYDLPKCLEDFLPKFDLKESDSLDGYVNKTMVSTHLIDV